MEFKVLYLLAASIIALTGLFFFIFGLRQLMSRRFGLSRRSLFREGWYELLGKRQASGRGTGLYFALFGLFMMLFCIVSLMMMFLTSEVFGRPNVSPHPSVIGKP